MKPKPARTFEDRWYAFVRMDDNVVVLRCIPCELTDKLVKPVNRYQLSGAGLLRVQWHVNEPCPLRQTREQAMVDLRTRLASKCATLQSQFVDAHKAWVQAEGELVEKVGRMTTWWEGVPRP